MNLVIYIMPDGYIGKSTEEERTVAMSESGGWVSIAMFGNRLATAKLWNQAIADKILKPTDCGCWLVPIEWLYDNRHLLPWIMRLGLRKRLDFISHWMCMHAYLADSDATRELRRYFP